MHSFSTNVLLLLLCFLFPILAEVYHVIPTPDSPECQEFEGASCLTLTQYADKPNSFFSSNITLLLHHGNHSLERMFSQNGFNSVNILTVNPAAVAIVTCFKKGNNNYFIFEEITEIYISGLNLIGCGYLFVSLQMLTIQNTNIKDQGTLLISNVKLVEINGGSFSSNIGASYVTSHNSLRVDGAIYVEGGTF